MCAVFLLHAESCFSQNSKPQNIRKDSVFTCDTISDKIFERIKGKSFPVKNTRISRKDLRYLRITHYGFDGKVHIGEMICNRIIANQLLDIFRELYCQKYQIEKIQLIDDFDGNDEKSMQANNTSCFNYRTVSGTSSLSAHARGMAVDINPRYNPYIRTKNGKRIVEPANAVSYTSKENNHTIKYGDKIHQLFIKRGFIWGGSWRTVKDYQHFEKK